MTSTAIKTLNRPINIQAYSGKLQQAITSGNAVEFSLLTPKLEPLHEPVTCRDYVSDAFWSEAVSKKGSVYGFSWEPGRIAIKKWYNLAMSFKDKDLTPYVAALKRFINEAETLLHIPESRFLTANGGEHQPAPCVVVTFAKTWSEKPIGLSLLTFLLRVGLTAEDRGMFDHLGYVSRHGNRPFGPYDQSYAAAADKWIKRFCDAGGLVVNQEYSQYRSMPQVHGSSGIYSFCERS